MAEIGGRQGRGDPNARGSELQEKASEPKRTKQKTGKKANKEENTRRRGEKRRNFSGGRGLAVW